MGGLNQDVGAAGGFVEETPAWTHYSSNTLGQIGTQANDATAAGGFDDSLSTDLADNAAGVQWDDHYTNPLAPGDTATYQLGWKFIDTLGLTPQTSSKLTGDTETLTASAGDLNGNPTPGKTINYTVTGANTFSGTAKTESDNKATISYVGGVPGDDTVTAFIDLNGNNIRDPNEAQAHCHGSLGRPAAPGDRPERGRPARAGHREDQAPAGIQQDLREADRAHRRGVELRQAHPGDADPDGIDARHLEGHGQPAVLGDQEHDRDEVPVGQLQRRSVQGDAEQEEPAHGAVDAGRGPQGLPARACPRAARRPARAAGICSAA